MTKEDKQTIQKKLDRYQIVIKEQHRMPKRERDHRLLASALDNSKRLQNWLN